MRAALHVTTILAAAMLALPATAAASADANDGSRPSAKEWSHAEGDWGNTRYSTLTQITPATVGKLGGAWVKELQAEKTHAIPVVADGKLFITAGKHLYALDPKTGQEIWVHDTPVAPSYQLKGVAVGDGLVFYGTADARIAAVNIKTGQLAWSTLIGEPNIRRGSESALGALTLTGQYISGAPTYVNGLVISGMSNGDFGIRGRVVALDAKTGKQVWRFDTIPNPGEIGHDTWPQDNDEWKQGGGGAWTTPAVDPELGLVFFGVGNPVPQWGGELRAGDNLFTDSVVALDLKTGKHKWHYQVTHHDIWEADLGTPVVLYDAEVDGKKRKALAVVSTNGFFYLLDRATGKPVFPTEERPVPQNPRLKTAPTQPFPVGADQIGTRCVDPAKIPNGFRAMCLYEPVDWTIPNAMYPINTTRAAPMAYSPDTRFFYAAGTDFPFWIQRYEDPKFFNAGLPSIPGVKYSGILAAVDSRTNKIVWRKEVPYEIQNGSGMTVTAGGVLFHGQPDGQFQAYDARTGDLLWQFQTGSAQSGPASVFEVDGEQYVAAVSERAVWAFKLGGTVQPLPAPPPPRTESAWGGRLQSKDQVSLGGTIKDTGLEFVRETHDEFAVLPARIRVKAGTAVTFTNNGKQPHQASAQDGSWTTGEIQPGQSAKVTFAKPGSWTYQCKDHPWSYGQVVVEE
jgi:alcohol dehydrogenase (cytochrome c)